MSKCKFKLGDYVISNSNHFPDASKGWIGKITDFHLGGSITVCGMSNLIKGATLKIINVDPRYFDLYTKDQPTKIVITTDGKTTTAKMYRDKSVVKVETTKCHPDDRFDFMVGAKIAFDRLVGCKKEEPETPKYYNGKVVCVDNKYYSFYTKGKIYQFVDGKFTTDDGDIMPYKSKSGVMSFKEWQGRSGAKWLEVVE